MIAKRKKLERLLRDGPWSISDIVLRINISRGTALRMIDKIENVSQGRVGNAATRYWIWRTR